MFSARATYAWVIDEDCLEGDVSRVGVTGPRNAPDSPLAELAAGGGHPFRMLDDDGNVCYRGRLAGDPTSEDGFGPLDDLGEPDAGCTAIEYLEAGQWVQL